MFATQVLARPSATEEIRDLLISCQYAANAREYAGQVVKALAAATDSQFAIWFDWPVHLSTVVAQTEATISSGLLALCHCAPLIDNDLGHNSGLRSIAAARVIFRSSVAGVLAVGNGARPYTAADLDLLAQTGRIALVQYETRRHAEELELIPTPQQVANLAHDLRQPLGILEACASVLELVLPSAETRAREHIREMHRQLDLAGDIIDQTVRGCTPRVAPSRVCANSAISMVT